MSIPAVLLAIALMAVVSASIGTVIFAITIVELPRVVRLIRGVVLSIREQAYVEAATVAGSRTWKILWWHILPNTIAPLTVQATYICAAAILIESLLSFLGAGTPPEVPSWGNIMAEGRSYFRLAPWIIHAIFLDTHSWIRWWTKEDLKLLADSQSSVAHCPTPFACYGHIMESFGDYVRAGVNMAIGTDTTPYNMIEEIRKAGTFARIGSRDLNNVSTGMLFHAATFGGAKALLRDDIGRLAPGCKADLVIVDLNHPDMMPARDPLRSLIFDAADRAVKDVWVAGRQVVANGGVKTLDHRDAGERLSAAQKRMTASTNQHDYRGRTIDQLAPLSLPIASL